MTDDERREVAAELRKLAAVTAYVHLPGSNLASLLFSAIHNGTEWDVSDRNPDGLFLNRLADLIEPEERTCRAGVFPDGAWAYVICCTECGYAIGGTWSDLGTARRMARAQHKFTNFCPNCGAKVIQE